MNQENALVPVERPKGLTPKRVTTTEIDRIEWLAQHASASGVFKGKLANTSSAAILICVGRDMGVSDTVALTQIFMVDGKPSPSANLLLSLILSNDEWDMREVERSDTRCELHFYKGATLRGKSIWTIDDARRAQLLGKDNWKKYPRSMLFARALTEGFRSYCPHLAGGVAVYTADELGAETDEEGTPIEAKPVARGRVKQLTAPEKPTPVVREPEPIAEAEVVPNEPAPTPVEVVDNTSFNFGANEEPASEDAGNIDKTTAEGIEALAKEVGVDIEAIHRNYKVTRTIDLTPANVEHVNRVLSTRKRMKPAS